MVQTSVNNGLVQRASNVTLPRKVVDWPGGYARQMIITRFLAEAYLEHIFSKSGTQISIGLRFYRLFVINAETNIRLILMNYNLLHES